MQYLIEKCTENRSTAANKRFGYGQKKKFQKNHIIRKLIDSSHHSECNQKYPNRKSIYDIKKH